MRPKAVFIGNRLGRNISITPANSTNRHLAYGRIILKDGVRSAQFNTVERETGLIALSGTTKISVAGQEFAHREKEDRQFGVVNVQPGFDSGGSGLEASRK